MQFFSLLVEKLNSEIGQRYIYHLLKFYVVYVKIESMKKLHLRDLNVAVIAFTAKTISHTLRRILMQA